MRREETHEKEKKVKTPQARNPADRLRSTPQQPHDPHRLPVVNIDGREYFVDERLHELRAVNNPHERLDL
jgi:hypothetical protein